MAIAVPDYTGLVEYRVAHFLVDTPVKPQAERTKTASCYQLRSSVYFSVNLSMPQLFVRQGLVDFTAFDLSGARFLIELVCFATTGCTELGHLMVRYNTSGESNNGGWTDHVVHRYRRS